MPVQAAGFGINGALLWGELVGAVAGADADGEGVAAGFGYEVDNLFGTGVVALGRGYFVFYAGQYAEFAFDGDIVLVGVFYYAAGHGHIFVVGQGAAVDHHAGESHVDAGLADVEVGTVVEVEHDLGVLAAELFGIGYSALGHEAEEGLVGIVACAFGYLEDHGALGLYCSHDDGLELLHIVEVECWDGIATADSLGKHVAGVDKAEFLIIYHDINIYYSIILSYLSI